MTDGFDRDELERRTKQLALRCIRLADALPWQKPAGRPMGQQLIRASTSVAANYRAARRARSDREFLAKLSIVVEEADETAFWIEMIVDAALIEEHRVADLRAEAERLMRLFAKSRKSLRDKLGNG
ncbi:MAG: four helix bundle protein [Planctomycetota bacterium]